MEQEEQRLRSAGIEPAINSKLKPANKLVSASDGPEEEGEAAGGRGGSMAPAVRSDAVEGQRAAAAEVSAHVVANPEPLGCAATSGVTGSSSCVSSAAVSACGVMVMSERTSTGGCSP